MIVISMLSVLIIVASAVRDLLEMDITVIEVSSFDAIEA